MHCDDVREEADAYALDAIEPAEREAIERHLALCPSCRALIQASEIVAARVALSAPMHRAPPELRHRLMQAIALPEQDRSRPDRSGTAPAVFSRRTAIHGRMPGRAWLVAVAAAVAVIAFAGAAGWIARLQIQVNGLEKRSQALQRNLAEVDGQRAAIMLLASNGSSRLQMEPTIYAPAAQGTVIWNPDRRQCSVLAAGLPPPAAGQTYHVWLVSGNRSWDHGELAPGPGGTIEKTIELTQIAPQRPYQVVLSLQPSGPGHGDWHPVLRAWVDSQ